MSILLVIDMQPQFKTSCRSWLIENVSREIRRAIDNGDGIIFLEYTWGVGCGGVAINQQTHRALTDLVVGEEHAVALVVHKEQDDGSREVSHAIKYWREHKSTIRVVGVNKGACVCDTVLGLSQLLPDTRIIVVGDACNGQYEEDTDEPSESGYESIGGSNTKIELPTQSYSVG